MWGLTLDSDLTLVWHRLRLYLDFALILLLPGYHNYLTLSWFCSDFALTLLHVFSDFAKTMLWFCSDFALISLWFCSDFDLTLLWPCTEFDLTLLRICSDFLLWQWFDPKTWIIICKNTCIVNFIEKLTWKNPFCSFCAPGGASRCSSWWTEGSENRRFSVCYPQAWQEVWWGQF